MTYQVNEIFDSIQGEGILAGTFSTFIRLQGCTVGCRWCDTKYTWAAGGTRMDVYDILEKVNATHVVITGGEPTLYNLDELVEELRGISCYIQLETSGQNELRGKLLPDWITWSPKAGLNYDAPDQIKQLCREVKWVVDEELEFSKVLDTSWALEQLRGENTPYMVFMPEGSPPRKEMVDKALSWLDVRKTHNDKWRYGDRLQWRIGVK